MTSRIQRDGYRYVREDREYFPVSVLDVLTGAPYYRSSWQLYERQHGRARRVGTCNSYEDVLAFLAGSNEHIKGAHAKGQE